MDAVIEAIAKATPYSIESIRSIYLNTASFDQTIQVVKIISKRGVSVDTALTLIDLIRNDTNNKTGN